MKVSELGEFGLIERIARFLPSPPEDVIVGLGDDVAVLRTGGPEYLLATCDVQIENVHFRLDDISPHDLGRKVVAINMSDIAATGGNPVWALVSLALPSETEVRFVDELYQGMREQMHEGGAAIVGGNMSGIERGVVIDFFLLGKVAPENIMLRSGAREGDLIFVTGNLGDSRAGLEVALRPELPVPAVSRETVLAKHFTPQPRLKEGQLLGRSGWVHAMADVSDGLLSDLKHICKASGVGAEVVLSALPIGPECRDVAQAAGSNARDWALGGGEDYELLFTAAPEFSERIQRMIEEETGTPCRVIGKIADKGQGIQLLSPDGGRTPLDLGPSGWDHFSKDLS